MVANRSHASTRDRRLRKRITVLLAIAILVSGASNTTSKPKPVVFQEERLVTPQERKAIELVAKRFVRRMMETRDLAPLLNEFFLNDFISFFTNDYSEMIAPELYRQLSDREKIRLFVAQQNLSYFMVLEMMSDPEADKKMEQSFRRIFPKRIAQILDPPPDNPPPPASRREILDGLVKLEKALVQARAILRRKKLEKTLPFKKDLARAEQDRYGIGYRVRALLLTEPMMDNRGMVKFHPGQKIFRVETPIFYGMVLVKVGEQYKVLFLEPADGD